MSEAINERHIESVIGGKVILLLKKSKGECFIMDKKCQKCGSANIIKGKLVGYAGVAFIPDESKGFRKKASAVTACACKDCGCIFDFELEYKEKII